MAYLHNNPEQFRDAINITYSQTGVATRIIEKDYYVTMILRLLAEKMPQAVFKGGTSLSKCHRVIKRFSEDIDISIDSALTQGQRRKFKDTVVEIADELGLTIENLDATRSRRDFNRYEILFNSVLPFANDALKPYVYMETVFSSVSFPNVVLPVYSYIGQMMETEAPELIESYFLSPFEMKVQGIDRTLADKVFAVCDYYLSDRTKGHSRHLYDIYKLLPRVPQDENFKKLVGEVRVVRKGMAVCPSAQDGVDISALIKQIMQEEAYKSDYNTITTQLLEEQIPYDTVVTALTAIINGHIFD